MASMIFTTNKHESRGSCFHGPQGQMGNARHLKIITKIIMSDPAQRKIKACAGELMNKKTSGHDFKKSTNNKCWRGCEEKGNLLHSWWKCKLVQQLQRTVGSFLKIKLKKKKH